MKVEFEFDPPEGDITPIEGVAVLYAYDTEGEPYVIYGDHGDPSSLAAIGLFTVGLRNAQRGFDEDGEEE